MSEWFEDCDREGNGQALLEQELLAMEFWLPDPDRPGEEISDQSGVARSCRKFHTIRAAYVRGMSVKAIAKEYGTAWPTVEKIVAREWDQFTPRKLED